MKKQRQLINDIKELYKHNISLKEFAKVKYLDEQNNAIIKINLTNNNIYDEYSDNISPSLLSYIEQEAYYIPVEYKIKLEISSQDEIDTKLLESKLKEHYYLRLADKKDDLKRNTITSILLAIIGIILLSLFFILKSIPQTKDLFNEIFSIAASFSIWESVDYALINRNALRIEYLNIAQLALLEIK